MEIFLVVLLVVLLFEDMLVYLYIYRPLLHELDLFLRLELRVFLFLDRLPYQG